MLCHPIQYTYSEVFCSDFNKIGTFIHLYWNSSHKKSVSISGHLMRNLTRELKNSVLFCSITSGCCIYTFIQTVISGLLMGTFTRKFPNCLLFCSVISGNCIYTVIQTVSSGHFIGNLTKEFKNSLLIFCSIISGPCI